MNLITLCQLAQGYERYPDRTAQMAELLSNAQTDGPVQIEPEMPTGKRY